MWLSANRSDLAAAKETGERQWAELAGNRGRIVMRDANKPTPRPLHEQSTPLRSFSEIVPQPVEHEREIEIGSRHRAIEAGWFGRRAGAPRAPARPIPIETDEIANRESRPVQNPDDTHVRRQAHEEVALSPLSLIFRKKPERLCHYLGCGPIRYRLDPIIVSGRDGPRFADWLTTLRDERCSAYAPPTANGRRRYRADRSEKRLPHKWIGQANRRPGVLDTASPSSRSIGRVSLKRIGENQPAVDLPRINAEPSPRRLLAKVQRISAHRHGSAIAELRSTGNWSKRTACRFAPSSAS